MVRKLIRLVFPYLNHHEVTQSYVWRHGLKLQQHIADEYRGGTVGHYYEFGVFRLRSIINFHKVRRLASWRNLRFKDVKIFAFDSFEGLPELTPEDVYDPYFDKGQYSCNLDEVRNIATQHKIPGIRYIKGFFENSLTQDLAIDLSDTPPGMVHIDCDTYSSTLSVLHWLDLIALPGALYFFDDLWCYHGHPEAGELGAINAYNADASMRGMLVEHPLGLGSRKVYTFCPRDLNAIVDPAQTRLAQTAVS